jgi:hypothetical protein
LVDELSDFVAVVDFDDSEVLDEPADSDELDVSDELDEPDADDVLPLLSVL